MKSCMCFVAYPLIPSPPQRGRIRGEGMAIIYVWFQWRHMCFPLLLVFPLLFLIYASWIQMGANCEFAFRLDRARGDHVSSFSLCVFVLLSLRVVHLTVQDGISTTIVCRVLLFVVWPLREWIPLIFIRLLAHPFEFPRRIPPNVLVMVFPSTFEPCNVGRQRKKGLTRSRYFLMVSM